MPAPPNNPGSASGGPLGLYVHWPFCETICPYCDFNVHVDDAVDMARWRGALLAEIDHFAAETQGRAVSSIFFGGGTPSRMAPDVTAAVIARVRDRWAVADDLEISLEANPNDIAGAADGGRLRAFRDAGVERLSLGVQSLDDRTLAFLGRRHRANDARRAAARAADVFPRCSLDMIYGLAGQEPQAWRAELTDAVSVAGEHVSAYQLTIEPGTAFHRDAVAVAATDLQADLYAIVQETLGGAGLAQYEVSNHARPGGECRHNRAIWQGADYIGIGPGAHGRIGGDAGSDGRTEALYQIHTPARWLAAVEAAGHGTAKRRALGRRQRAEEVLMLGLRLADGIAARTFQARTGIALADMVDPDALRHLQAGGLIESDGLGLRATTCGLAVLDAVLARLLAAEGDADG